MEDSARKPRPDNRRQSLIDAAAAAFREYGYHAASMREVAGRAGMLAGSVYYHFPSKDDLLVAVYAEGVKRLSEQVQQEIEGVAGPWPRLRRALEAHLDGLLDSSDYAQVVIRVLPVDAPAVEQRLVALRHDYENIFRSLIDELDMTEDKKHYLRLFLIGACNWTQVWYRKEKDSPRDIARHLTALLEAGR